MEDYELFTPLCNVLSIEEQPELFPLEYEEYREGEARVNDIPAHQFPKDGPIRYEEAKLKETNLGEASDPKKILVGDD